MGSTTAAAIAAIAIFDRKLLLKESSELILLVLLFNYTDLLIGFAVFFCFWHSWDAIAVPIARIETNRQKNSTYCISLKRFFLIL
jgi:hypothetical protein